MRDITPTLCASVEQIGSECAEFTMKQIALPTRRVRQGCYYHDRADCEAGAIIAIKAAEAFRSGAFAKVVIITTERMAAIYRLPAEATVAI